MAGKQRYTVQQVANALRETKGMLTKTAEKLGCEYLTVRHYLARYPELEEVRKEAHNRMGDEVELALYNLAVKDLNPTALIFLAKTKFRNRGYTETLHVTDWRTDAINAIKAGDITRADLERELGGSLADELFRQAGVTVMATASED